jgi:uncharacterized membrane protein YccC
MLLGSERWLFSIKTFAAAMLALSICLWLDLSRPYWAMATVYITSHPLSGATRSKALFRTLGTLIGSAASILLVPNLANSPLLLSVAMALWTAFCLYVSLLDKTPRSYVFMLAGYTAALIGFPAVDAPGSIFDIALARTEEIIIGILCGALVSSLVFPRRVGPAVALRLRNWGSHADKSAADALGLRTGKLTDMHRLQLAADTSEIESLASYLSFDGGQAAAVDWARQLHPRMLMLLPILSSIADRLGELMALGGLSPAAEALLARTRQWLEEPGPHDPAVLEGLRGGIAARIASHREGGSWHDLIELGFLLRLKDFVEIRTDCATLADAMARGLPRLGAPLLFPLEERVERVRHLDHGFAAFAAMVSAVTILSCCAFWIMTGWPDGSTAAMMAAVATSLFATQDNPAPTITLFAKLGAASMPVAAIYLFGILPNVHTLETLMLAFAPAYLVFGALMASPRTAIYGVSFAVNSISAMALQGTYAVDAALFLNSGIAMVAGMGLGAGASAILITLGAEWGVWRIGRANRATLAEAANTRTANEEVRVAGLLLDRMVHLAPRVAAAGHTIPDVLRDLRTGFNILDLHRASRSLPPYSRRRVDAFLVRMTRHYRQSETPQAPILDSIDRALTAIGKDSTSGAREALLGLVGLRRGLFPDAPPLSQPHQLEAIS